MTGVSTYLNQETGTNQINLTMANIEDAAGLYRAFK